MCDIRDSEVPFVRRSRSSALKGGPQGGRAQRGFGEEGDGPRALRVWEMNWSDTIQVSHSNRLALCVVNLGSYSCGSFKENGRFRGKSDNTPYMKLERKIAS